MFLSIELKTWTILSNAETAFLSKGSHEFLHFSIFATTCSDLVVCGRFLSLFRVFLRCLPCPSFTAPFSDFSARIYSSLRPASSRLVLLCRLRRSQPAQRLLSLLDCWRELCLHSRFLPFAADRSIAWPHLHRFFGTFYLISTVSHLRDLCCDGPAVVSAIHACTSGVRIRVVHFFSQFCVLFFVHNCFVSMASPKYYCQPAAPDRDNWRERTSM